LSFPPQTELSRLRTAVLYTDHGQITFDLFPEIAPWHVANLKYLADKKFFKISNSTSFTHVTLFKAAIQREEAMVVLDIFYQRSFRKKKHILGTLGMARAPDAANPERLSHGSQFYITLGNALHMDGLYTVFGQLRSGEAALKKLRRDDTIRDFRVFVRQ
jgi:cyclophilin family peptidyl-prolyl cis-trans isomerase